MTASSTGVIGVANTAIEGDELATPPATPTDNLSPGIKENAVLNDPNSLSRDISYPENEELWSDLCLERLFSEEPIESNQTSNNSAENIS